jgi:ubiquinone/menaquinone biosynthesis C-methylase UbiE
MPGRGERTFARLPGFGASLYGMLARTRALQRQYQEITQDLIKRLETGRVLDIGTGPGFLLAEIHRHAPHLELHGLDISAAMLKKARQNLDGSPMELKQGSAAELPYPDNYFDLVTATGSLYLWERPFQALSEIRRVLRPGRQAILYETHRHMYLREFRQQIVKNLAGETALRRWLAQSLLRRQIQSAYNLNELISLLERSVFAESYEIQHTTLVDLPIWVRLVLDKPGDSDPQKAD